MEHSLVASIGDFLIARAEREVDLAHSILEDARGKNEYFREKAAAKIFAYYELELELIKHYVEIKIYYPHSAGALEEQKPYLFHLWNEAERERMAFLNKSE
jgi:hypothetical protein